MPQSARMMMSRPLLSRMENVRVGNSKGTEQVWLPRGRVSRERVCSRMFYPGLSGCVGKRGRPKSTCDEANSAKVRRRRQPVSGPLTGLAEGDYPTLARAQGGDGSHRN